MKTQSYREIQAGWRWMKDAGPEAAAAAKQWTKDHPEEWKEIEHMLYYSESNFHKRFAFDELEDAEMKQPLSYDPEAFLPEEVRNAIYEDRRWFDRAKYLPEGSDENPLMYLNTQLVAGLQELTELQREVLFRTVINGESTESVAQDKQCSARNIRDIRNRALKQLRGKITRHGGYGKPGLHIIVLFFILLACMPFIYWGERLWGVHPLLEYVGCANAAAVIIFLLIRSRSIEVRDLLRRHWAGLNGAREK